VGDGGLVGVEVVVLSTSSPTDEVIPCFVAFNVLAPSEPGDKRVEMARGALFRSTNLKAGNFEGLWSRRCACNVMAFCGSSESSSTSMLVLRGSGDGPFRACG
jgi:hypothetical protein